MTDDNASEDAPFAMDESPTHHIVVGRTGTGKTTRLIELLSGENAPEWIDPKANDESVTDRSEN